MTKKKLTYQDNFEMLYLRHDFINRIKNANQININEFIPIANKTAKLMFEKYKPNFEKVSFDLDDVISISYSYTLAYIGLYSLRKNKKTMDRFVQKCKKIYGQFYEISESDVVYQEKSNLVNFLRQKFKHCNTLCARKSKNIIASKEIRRAFAETSNSSPVSDEELIRNYKKYGYRKVTKKELAEIEKNCKDKKISSLYDKNGFRVIKIEILSENTKSLDNNTDIQRDKNNTRNDRFMLEAFDNFSEVFGTNTNHYNSSPEDFLIQQEDNLQYEENLEKYKQLKIEERFDYLENHSKKNKKLKKLFKKIDINDIISNS